MILRRYAAPMHTACYALLSNHACHMLIGACNSMLCPFRVFRAGRLLTSSTAERVRCTNNRTRRTNRSTTRTMPRIVPRLIRMARCMPRLTRLPREVTWRARSQSAEHPVLRRHPAPPSQGARRGSYPAHFGQLGTLRGSNEGRATAPRVVPNPHTESMTDGS